MITNVIAISGRIFVTPCLFKAAWPKILSNFVECDLDYFHSQMLSEASARTKEKKEEADTMEGATVIAPTIQRKQLPVNVS